MAKKIRIDIDFSSDNALIGISCHRKDYWLAFQINDKMNLDLRQIDDFTVKTDGAEEELKYPLYYYEDEDKSLSFYLLTNHHPNGKLFPDLKTTDYFMLIHGTLSHSDKTTILSHLKKLPNVLTAFEIKLNQIKESESFLSDLELHMIRYLKGLGGKNP
jgi:hypothetical protein